MSRPDLFHALRLDNSTLSLQSLVSNSEKNQEHSDLLSSIFHGISQWIQPHQEHKDIQTDDMEGQDALCKFL